MLRTLDDSLALRRRLEASRRVVVIGAGFIGLEVAATAAQSGCAVTVLEGAAGADDSWPRRGDGRSRGHGCTPATAWTVRCGVQVAGIQGADGRVDRRVAWATASSFAADVVVVGIGVSPATEWLAGSGLELRDGIVCDASLARRRPAIYAAGDCARWVNNLFGESGEEMRVEHWTNAAEQGAAAAQPAGASSPANPDAVRAGAVLLERPVRQPHPVRRPGPRRRRGSRRSPAISTAISWRCTATAADLRGVLGVSMPKPVMRLRKLIGRAGFLGGCWIVRRSLSRNNPER